MYFIKLAFQINNTSQLQLSISVIHNTDTELRGFINWNNFIIINL